MRDDMDMPWTRTEVDVCANGYERKGGHGWILPRTGPKSDRTYQSGGLPWCLDVRSDRLLDESAVSEETIASRVCAGSIIASI